MRLTWLKNLLFNSPILNQRITEKPKIFNPTKANQAWPSSPRVLTLTIATHATHRLQITIICMHIILLSHTMHVSLRAKLFFFITSGKEFWKKAALHVVPLLRTAHHYWMIPLQHTITEWSPRCTPLLNNPPAAHHYWMIPPLHAVIGWSPAAHCYWMIPLHHAVTEWSPCSTPLLNDPPAACRYCRLNEHATYTAAETHDTFQWTRQPPKIAPNTQLLGPTRVHPQKASWKVQPFLQGSSMYPTDRQTDTQTDQTTSGICHNRPRLCTASNVT